MYSAIWQRLLLPAEPYALVMTPEVRAWLHDLRKRDRASAVQVGQATGMLLEAGPTASTIPG